MTVVPFPRPSTPKQVLTSVLSEGALCCVVVFIDKTGTLQVRSCEPVVGDETLSLLTRAVNRICRMIDYGQS